MGKMNEYPRRFYVDGDFIHISGDSAFSAGIAVGGFLLATIAMLLMHCHTSICVW